MILEFWYWKTKIWTVAMLFFNCLAFQWIQLPFSSVFQVLLGTHFRVSIAHLWWHYLQLPLSVPAAVWPALSGTQRHENSVCPCSYAWWTCVDTLPTLIWGHFYWGVLMRKLVLDFLEVNVQGISGLSPSTCPVVLLFIAMLKEIRKCCIFIKNMAYNLIISKDNMTFYL